MQEIEELSACPGGERVGLAGGLGSGVVTPGLADFLDHAAANIGPAEAANGLAVGFGVNDREPGYAAIEHDGGGHKDGVVKRDTNGIGWKKIAEFAARQVAPFFRWDDSNAGDHIVKVIAVQSAPEALLFVEDQ